MRKSEIRVGGFYTDGKQGLREVVEEGAHLNTYGATNTDCIKYQVHTSAKPSEVGTDSNMTRSGLATWASEEVLADDVEGFKLFRAAASIEKGLTTAQRRFLETFEATTGPSGLVECERSEFPVAQRLKLKGLIKSMPDSLTKGQDRSEAHFKVELSELGEFVLRAVHSQSLT